MISSAAEDMSDVAGRYAIGQIYKHELVKITNVTKIVLLCFKTTKHFPHRLFHVHGKGYFNIIL